MRVIGPGLDRDQMPSRYGWRPPRRGETGEKQDEVQGPPGFASAGDGSGGHSEAMESHWQSLKRSRSHLHLILLRKLMNARRYRWDSGCFGGGVSFFCF